MQDKIRKKLYSAIIRILRPLIRILLKYGISYGTFSELAKWIFVDVAAHDFTIGERKQTISRISVITGLTRKEVKRMAERKQADETLLIEKYNRAARAVSGWRRDKEFTDQNGQPLILPLDGKIASFTQLVRRYCGDLPVKPVMDELLCSGTIGRERNGNLKLLTPEYLANQDPEMKVHILGREAGRLIATIGHNFDPKNEPPRLQRTVSYDNLPEEILPSFREISTDNTRKLLKKLDDWLASHDRDTSPEVQGSGRFEAGIGIYYFEETVDEEIRTP